MREPRVTHAGTCSLQGLLNGVNDTGNGCRLWTERRFAAKRGKMNDAVFEHLRGFLAGDRRKISALSRRASLSRAALARADAALYRWARAGVLCGGRELGGSNISWTEWASCLAHHSAASRLSLRAVKPHGLWCVYRRRHTITAHFSPTLLCLPPFASSSRCKTMVVI